MKTFRELISWELQQERKMRLRLQADPEDATQKLSATVLRKMRYLSSPSFGEAARNGGASAGS